MLTIYTGQRRIDLAQEYCQVLAYNQKRQPDLKLGWIQTHDWCVTPPLDDYGLAQSVDYIDKVKQDTDVAGYDRIIVDRRVLPERRHQWIDCLDYWQRFLRQYNLPVVLLGYCSGSVDNVRHFCRNHPTNPRIIYQKANTDKHSAPESMLAIV